MTPFHARYFAVLLARRGGQGQAERYLPALMSANIDLHPHQIEAAIFAGRADYRDGVILADEQNLGKTIEAGIVLLQAAIEGQEQLLVLCPANLLSHWREELREKFGLSCYALGERGEGRGVCLLSYQEAYQNAPALSRVRWNICVLDEAHLLANAGLQEGVMSDAIRTALTGCPKLLLTSAPMQNSLLDLYYLIRFVDEDAFGADPEAFRAKYMGNKPLKQELAARCQEICFRTLKAQALTMHFPRRVIHTVFVPPTQAEDALSKRMSLYFHRETLAAFPKIQEHRIRLTYWKLLASSPCALSDSLGKVTARLASIAGAEDELRDLTEVAQMAAAIQMPARGTALLAALREASTKLKAANAPKKIMVVTEYRQTAKYLQELLAKTFGEGAVAAYTGGGSKKGLEVFRRGAHILITTDCAIPPQELPPCACLINYDLPWNAQTLERRIARLGRYGQHHDILVTNLLDPSNRADRRTYTVLNKKLRALDATFGVSDAILGTTSAGPRTAAEIAAELDRFAQTHRQEIDRRMEQAEADLLAHFDLEVQARFKHHAETIPAKLTQMEDRLWAITQYKLKSKAVLRDETRTILLDKSPYKGLRLSRLSFGMDKGLPRGERYHLAHPLARRVLADCLDGQMVGGTITLQGGGAFPPGASGVVGLWQLHAMSKSAYQVIPVLCGYRDGGDALTQDECEALLALPALSYTGGQTWVQGDVLYDPNKSCCTGRLEAIRDTALAAAQGAFEAEQGDPLSEELEKLRRRAEDEGAGLRCKIAELERTAADTAAQAKTATDFSERFRLNQAAAELIKQRRKEEERLFLLGAEVEQRRKALTQSAVAQRKVRVWNMELFVVNWQIESFV